MMKKSKYIFLALVATMVGCKSGDTTEQPVVEEQKEVNVYTHRHYDVDKTLFAKFEEETGIKVNVVSASADELLVKLQQEGKTTHCDLLMTTDAARMFKAKEMGLLQPVSSAKLDAQIPAAFRDDEQYWYGVSKRARVIAMKKGLKEKHPNFTYEDLANKEWRGKVVMRSSESMYNQSLLAALVAHHDAAWAEQWVKNVVANFAREPKGSDRDQIKDIAAGEGEITLVNSYYLGKMEFSPNPAERSALEFVEVVLPNQNTTGTFADISSGAVTKFAKNKDAAVLLLEFFTREDNQNLIAAENHEYPVNGSGELKGIVGQLAGFVQDTIDLELTGKLNTEAVVAFDKGGWR